MEISRDKIERLVFVKYLLFQANKQQNLERPLSSSAILTIHDSVECFLQLCFEITTSKTKLNSQNILATYCEEINKVLLENKKQQINSAYIKRINDLRNQLKHATIFVDEKQIPNLFTETEMFFNDFTESIFGLAFAKISLIELISDETIKSILAQAEQEIENAEYFKAMRQIGIAFYELKSRLTKLHGSKNENIFGSIFQVDYMIKYGAQFGGSYPDSVLRENLGEIANDINHLQDDIVDIKTILSLSVDIKYYVHFERIIPKVHGILTGKDNIIDYWAVEDNYDVKPIYTLEEVKKSLNFVTELGLKV